MERAVPSFFSANAITLIGQLPLQLMVLVVFSNTGGHISPDNGHSERLMILSGAALIWFSMVDIMDGCRARRLKCGSPLGRLIDEGGDLLTQSNYPVLLGYAWNLTHPLAELVIFALNFVNCAMEVKFIVTGELVMNSGELSSVEVESIFALVLFQLGYFGNGIFEKTIGESLGIASESSGPLAAICDYNWSALLGVSLFLL